MVCVIYDLYPDVAVESGHVTNPLVLLLARWVERVTYRLSDRIVVLSDGFRESLVARGVSEGKIWVVPVWLQPDEISPRDRDTEFRRRHGIGKDQLVVLYAGTIGIVSGAAIMLDVAERLRTNPRVIVLFVGEGQVRENLESEAKSRELTNVRFLPFQPRELLNEVQASADISVVTLAPGRGRTSVPSKVIGYLAAGRPVVASVDLDSDTAKCIERAECGEVVPPGDPEGLAATLAALLADPVSRERLGGAARRAFDREYAAPTVLTRYCTMLESLGTRHTAP
jgi:colanic acid biosynthesis glycosyl transferase WcaI